LSRWLIRTGSDGDGPALIALIWSCWKAYPGVRMDVDREMPELHALATYYAARQGALWVAEQDGRVVGMIAARRHEHSAVEICRVYVDPSLHGGGLAHALLDRAEAFAIAAGADRLLLWSDTRFDRAHRFYEKRSYVRTGPIRVLHDISNSLEFAYAKPVNGLQLLDAAAARSAAAPLAGILRTCADAGESPSFLAPLAPDNALAFWHRAATEVGTGQRIIVAAWQNGILSGVGSLQLTMPETQPHRTELQDLLVTKAARRAGIGRAILQALERAALDQSRTLLTLHAKASDSAEALFRSEQWQEAGRIPDFFCGSGGTMHAAIIFLKRIA
jgi:GNAT superfamily N-acetyltransferase